LRIEKANLVSPEQKVLDYTVIELDKKTSKSFTGYTIKVDIENTMINDFLKRAIFAAL